MSSGEQEALRLAKGLRDGTLLLSERDEAAEWLERLHAENEALRAERDTWADRAARRTDDWNAACAAREADREAMRMALDALKTELSHGPLIKECHDAISALEQRVGES
jgi:hypothetical protein